MEWAGGVQVQMTRDGCSSPAWAAAEGFNSKFVRPLNTEGCSAPPVTAGDMLDRRSSLPGAPGNCGGSSESARPSPRPALAPSNLHMHLRVR